MALKCIMLGLDFDLLYKEQNLLQFAHLKRKLNVANCNVISTERGSMRQRCHL